eukprot:CAMPEP_0114679908 /NCGR_PEP_ID=MMETSP0191-20121206/53455_1 /TAXON_ID=126664 /ORGANISM="Sorites sp." /LENGTH=258 /DNA_ID=CAMNT_0001955875 /DNA_START=690 /DNA_END=1466 /DNA_ORIENTATION=+
MKDDDDDDSESSGFGDLNPGGIAISQKRSESRRGSDAMRISHSRQNSRQSMISHSRASSRKIVDRKRKMSSEFDQDSVDYMYEDRILSSKVNRKPSISLNEMISNDTDNNEPSIKTPKLIVEGNSGYTHALTSNNGLSSPVFSLKKMKSDVNTLNKINNDAKVKTRKRKKSKKRSKSKSRVSQEVTSPTLKQNTTKQISKTQPSTPLASINDSQTHNVKWAQFKNFVNDIDSNDDDDMDLPFTRSRKHSFFDDDDDIL